jgi:hypothetical protein
MFRNKITLVFLLVLIIKSTAFYSQMSLSENTTVSVLTCDKGDELYSIFGHTAFRIKDDTNSLDVVYNYGMFDFRTENFYLKFIKGDLQYFVAAYSFNEFFYQYNIENRSIYEQELRLSAAQKQQLFDDLNATLFSDKKYYTYKFIDRNCTTKVMDDINKMVGQNCVKRTTDLDKTYREILYPYVENHFYENLGINIIFGKKVDQLGKKLFLPKELMESLKTAKLDNILLAKKSKILFDATKIPSPISIWNNFYTFSTIFMVLLASRKKWIYLSLLGIFGIMGIFLSLVGLYSYHEEVAYNYNVLLFNPILLLLLYFYWKKKFRWINYLSFINMIFLGVYSIVFINKPNLMMFLPMILSSALILFYFNRWSKSKLKQN